jgi:hypothetical protein
MVELRRMVDDLCADREDAVVEHSFDVSGAFGVPSKPRGGVVYGWETTVHPASIGSALWIWFDGLDEDLAVMIDELHWFEWRDREDADAVVSEAAGLCAGVLAGNLWEWETRRGKGCDVMLPDGRVLTAAHRKSLYFPWSDPQKVLHRRQLPAYGG